MGVHDRILRSMLNTLSPRAREARLGRFAKMLSIQPGQRVIDLGGSVGLWRFVRIPLKITILNIERQQLDDRDYGNHHFTFVQGDATNVVEYRDYSFDIAFSNSCIEHVGPASKQAAFAREVRRLAPAYYVQTPAPTFPIEAHTGLPLWWLYPEMLRSRLIQRWQVLRPEYGDFISGTRALRRREIKDLFPDARIDVEKVLGMTKSYAAWRAA